MKKLLRNVLHYPPWNNSRRLKHTGSAIFYQQRWGASCALADCLEGTFPSWTFTQANQWFLALNNLNTPWKKRCQQCKSREVSLTELWFSRSGAMSSIQDDRLQQVGADGCPGWNQRKDCLPWQVLSPLRLGGGDSRAPPAASYLGNTSSPHSAKPVWARRCWWASQLRAPGEWVQLVRKDSFRKFPKVCGEGN